MTVAACWTVSRRAVTVGSRDLTTASANLGRLVYNTSGFYITQSYQSLFLHHHDEEKERRRRTLRTINPNNFNVAFLSPTSFAPIISKLNVVINNGVLTLATLTVAALARFLNSTGVDEFFPVARPKRSRTMAMASK